jgi:hypothetical protein
MNNQKWMSRATQEEKAMAYDLLVVGGHVDESNALRSLRVARVALKRAPAPPAVAETIALAGDENGNVLIRQDRP